MAFLQEVSLEIIICAYFINGMFVVGVIAMDIPIYTPFDTTTTVNGINIPDALRTNSSNNIVQSMTTDVGNVTTSNPLQILLQANPFAFMQYVFIFLQFITGTFFFQVMGALLVGEVATAFAFIIGGFVLFCLGRTILFYTRGV